MREREVKLRKSRWTTILSLTKEALTLIAPIISKAKKTSLSISSEIQVGWTKLTFVWVKPNSDENRFSWPGIELRSLGRLHNTGSKSILLFVSSLHSFRMLVDYNSTLNKCPLLTSFHQSHVFQIQRAEQDLFGGSLCFWIESQWTDFFKGPVDLRFLYVRIF